MASFARTGRKIVAIGRNYQAHIKELSNATPTEPFFFLKPTTSYLPSSSRLELPRGIIAHHEVELGIVVGKRGRDVSEEEAMDYVSGYALAVDMTARNLQDQVRKKGLPWSAAKGFDGFTPIGKYIPKSEIKDPYGLRLSLSVNGKVKQDGVTSDMIFKIPRLIQHISSIMTLEENDLILTGTPSGVGSLAPGDIISCLLRTKEEQVLDTLEFEAVQREGGYLFKPEQ